MDIPFELVPESEAECLRLRLAVQKRAERLALRDRMRARRKIRVSLDGQPRWVRGGGGWAEHAAPCDNRQPEQNKAECGGVALPQPSAACLPSGCPHAHLQPLPGSACPPPTSARLPLLCCSYDSDSGSDGEKEAMRQALSNATSNASEDAAATPSP